MALLNVDDLISFLQFNKPSQAKNDLPLDAVLASALHYLGIYKEYWVSVYVVQFVSVI